jgi:hypothetical protein
MNLKNNVVQRIQGDICDLSRFDDGQFDSVVCYGGPLSYVFDKRTLAMNEMLRVVKPGGHILLSVMSLIGTIKHFLEHTVDWSIENGTSEWKQLLDTGDLTGIMGSGDHRTPTFTCIPDEPTTYDWRRSAPSECTGVYINPAPWSPGFMSPVFLLPVPSLYSRFLRCNVWKMVARNRALFWSCGSIGRKAPARHHGAIRRSENDDGQLRYGVAGGFLVICFYIKDFAGVGINTYSCFDGNIMDIPILIHNVPYSTIRICIPYFYHVSKSCIWIFLKI